MEINRRKVYPAAHSSRSTYPQCVGGSGLETALPYYPYLIMLYYVTKYLVE